MDTFRCLIVRNPGDLRFRQRISADEVATTRPPDDPPATRRASSASAARPLLGIRALEPHRHRLGTPWRLALSPGQTTG
ncbi:hypothetical protein SSPO_007510 [Streptomyces antimycoticus]|uniref:Uncharacterized protein n=1 Tax=Streptomyces antimycoticus TaxID=68175 RepID=A0A499UB55_9ACTN|nr:hypothetical protein SSPO_007510 [Streptomyces antimycoticus]